MPLGIGVLGLGLAAALAACAAASLPSGGPVPLRADTACFDYEERIVPSRPGPARWGRYVVRLERFAAPGADQRNMSYHLDSLGGVQVVSALWSRPRADSLHIVTRSADPWDLGLAPTRGGGWEGQGVPATDVREGVLLTAYVRLAPRPCR